MLEALFESEKKEKILFFLYSYGEGYAREIARTFQFNLNTVQNQLMNLESHGILYSKLKGRVRLFGFNPRYPFKKELEALLKKAMMFLPEDEVRKYYFPRLRPRRTGKPLEDMDFKNISIRKLAIFLCDYLSKQGIETVLTGGACVSIYTKNKFLSYDLDFVLLDTTKKKRIIKILEKIGFQQEGRHFRHSDTPFIVEFLSPPLSIGEEPVKKVQTIQENDRKLKLLSPTDCVKDRLAAFFHWNDKPSLEQAVMVSSAESIDLKEIERWSSNEGMEDKYSIFLDDLKKAQQSLE